MDVNHWPSQQHTKNTTKNRYTDGFQISNCYDNDFFSFLCSCQEFLTGNRLCMRLSFPPHAVLMLTDSILPCVSLRCGNRVIFPQLCISVSWVSSLAAGHMSNPSGEEEPARIHHQERFLSAWRKLPRWNSTVRYMAGLLGSIWKMPSSDWSEIS